MNETYSALREYHKRIVAMLDDPECTGDLLSLGIALLDYAILDHESTKSWKHYATRAWGDHGDYRVRDVLRKDIRRYDANRDADAHDPARLCGAPMIRRQGPCNNSGTLRALLTDPDTGRQQWLAACSRHRDWFEARVRTNRAANTVPSVDPIAPPANAGGVLARHIPEIDWPKTWVKLNPKWTPPPESEPEEVPLKPRLTLLFGGAS